MTATVTVRMYRHGLGDCFLVTLPKTDGSVYTIMFDCGVILGTRNPIAAMKSVVRNVAKTTSNHVDLLVATHEHWDHLSGFVQAEAELVKIHFDQVWLGWTEDENDQLANRIREEREKAFTALHERERQLRGFGLSALAEEVSSLLAFYGATAQSTGDAMRRVEKRADFVRYCSPGEAPVRPDGAAFRIYVLGPPRDTKVLRKVKPSRSHPETYGLAASEVARRLLFDATESPFGVLQSIPWRSAQSVEFFRDRYFEPKERDGLEKGWRRIDITGLDDTSDLALQLDSATNNTCLVLAIELDDGRVLLFPGDAQVGSWLSWQELKWRVDGKTVTGPDLLARTVFYKVGHHGSHNATLRGAGLDLMKNLNVAMIPVDGKMALQKRWTQMPKPQLLAALRKKARRGVVRADEPAPSAVKARAGPGRLYYEVSL